jgi:hypothetical protein
VKGKNKILWKSSDEETTLTWKGRNEGVSGMTDKHKAQTSTKGKRREGDKYRKEINEREKFILPVTYDGSCATNNVIDENITRQYEKFTRHGDLEPGICAGLITAILFYFCQGLTTQVQSLSALNVSDNRKLRAVTILVTAD